MGLSFFLAFFKGIFYQISVASLASSLYDDANYDIFSFISISTSFCFIIFQLFMQLFQILLFIFYKKALDIPKIEELIGSLYEDYNLKQISIIHITFLESKLVLILMISFVFQNAQLLQLILISLIYFISLITLILKHPYTNILANVQNIIRESLFLIIIILFDVYLILSEKKMKIFVYVKEVILFGMMTVFLNELIFTTIQMIKSFIESCQEEKIHFFKFPLKTRFRKIKNEFAKHKLYSIAFQNGRYFYTKRKITQLQKEKITKNGFYSDRNFKIIVKAQKEEVEKKVESNLIQIHLANQLLKKIKALKRIFVFLIRCR